VGEKLQANRHLAVVLETPWLLIIDNLESEEGARAQDVMDLICPTHGCGNVLVTCRSELLAASVADGAAASIEVPAFTPDEGAELLLRRLGRAENSLAASESDRSASLELAELLGGHALMLDVMARTILAKRKQLSDFVRMYKRKPRPLHQKPRNMVARIANQYYRRSEDAESLWAIPFQQLDSAEAAIMRVLCMCGPNKVPSTLFIPDNREGLTDLVADEDE
jgi:hypothetical protein